MAYVLGFFTADGCMTINPRGSHFIEFSSNDCDVLEKIKIAMGSGHKIGCRKYNSKRLQDSYRLQIGSKEIFNDLESLGFTVNKSKIVKFPRVPSKYFADFLRGYFDGDGCVSFGAYYYKDRKNKKYHIITRFTCANKSFLIDLSNQIKKLVRTEGNSIFLGNGAYDLSYSVNDSLKILKFIYNKPSIYLDRKFKSCKMAIEGYNQFMDR
jgi:intein-encoded DNA endonuclease-like protein